MRKSFLFLNRFFLQFDRNRRSWLLRQLFPRSLLDQFSIKQITHRLRTHLQMENNENQLTVAKEFLRLFAEHTRSFAGKLFPVKFPVKKNFSFCFNVFLLTRKKKLLFSG